MTQELSPFNEVSSKPYERKLLKEVLNTVYELTYKKLITNNLKLNLKFTEIELNKYQF